MARPRLLRKGGKTWRPFTLLFGMFENLNWLKLPERKRHKTNCRNPRFSRACLRMFWIFCSPSRAIEKENMRVAKAVWIGRAEHRHNVSLLLECGIKRTIVHVRSHSWNRLRFCVWGFIGRCLRSSIDRKCNFVAGRAGQKDIAAFYSAFGIKN